MKFIKAGMAELVDAHGSGPCERKFLQVQILLPAPYLYSNIDTIEIPVVLGFICV